MGNEQGSILNREPLESPCQIKWSKCSDVQIQGREGHSSTAVENKVWIRFKCYWWWFCYIVKLYKSSFSFSSVNEFERLPHSCCVYLVCILFIQSLCFIHSLSHNLINQVYCYGGLGPEDRLFELAVFDTGIKLNLFWCYCIVYCSTYTILCRQLDYNISFKKF